MDTSKTTNLFHDRLILAAGDLSFRQLGEITETHPETVRRYMNGHAPSTVFLSKLCLNLGISGEWLLSGQEPMMTRDVPLYTLKNAKPDQLMLAVSELLVDLADRLERTEKLVHRDQGIELKLNASA